MDPINPSSNDEMDIIEVLGIVLRWRKVVISIVLVATVSTAIVLSIKNCCQFSPKYFGEVKQDSLFVSNAFFDKNTDQDKYKKFIKALLFTANVNVPKFEIRIFKSDDNSDDNSTVFYLFESEKDRDNFMSRYNIFLNDLHELQMSRDNISGTLVENCRKFFSTTQFGSPKDLHFFFKDASDIKKCTEYNYYHDLIQDRFAYASEANTIITETYLDFLSRFIKNDFELSKMTTIQSRGNKTNVKFNIKKIVKYSIVTFLFSLMSGIVCAFILEFWSINKKRILEYLK